MSRKYESIQTKILKLSVGMVIIGLVLMVSLIIYTGRQEATNNYISSSNEQIKVVGGMIENFYEQIDENINMIATHPTVRKGDHTITILRDTTEATFITPSINGGIEQEIYEVFKQYVDTHPGTKYIYLATKEGGYVEWPEVDMPAGYDPTVRGWYQLGIEGNGYIKRTEPYEDTTGGMVVSNVRKAVDSEGNLIGVVGIDVEQSAISNMLSHMKMGEEGYFIIVHENGVIMADGNNPENNFKNISEVNIEGLDKILGEETSVFEVNIEGEEHLVNAQRIGDTGWIVAGLMSRDEINQASNATARMFAVVSIVMLAGISVLIINGVKKIAVPIKKSAEHLEAIGNADFSEAIDVSYIEQNDEVGIIFTGLHHMKDALVQLITGIRGDSLSIEDQVENIQANVTKLNQNLEDISATTEELAASMEQTSTTTKEMSTISREIQEAIATISDRSREGADSATRINQRANETREKALTSNQKIQTVFGQTKEKLEQAIDSSKVVGQINILSEAIMQITEQTNLLALNAAIEAARAGEAGKGFSVVADEIGTLAKKSKETVLEIQGITGKVTGAVENLSESANELLGFMSTDVTAGYEMMSDVAEQYSEDAKYVEDLVSEFSATAQELSASMESIAQSIEWVSSASGQGAIGTNDIANRVGEISGSTSAVMKQINETKEVADHLAKEIQHFKL